MAKGGSKAAADKKAAAKKAAAAKKGANEQKAQEAADLKRKQANLVTQGKAATEKLRKVQNGEQTVDADQLQMLESKVAFYNEYSCLPKNSEGKLAMLARFDQDRTGLKWLQRSTEVSQATSVTEGDSVGYLSSALASYDFFRRKPPRVQEASPF